MSKILSVALALSLSAPAFASDLSGHWKDSNQGRLTCKNGYAAQCVTDLKLMYSPPHEYFQMILNSNCLTPEPMNIYIESQTGLTLRNGQISTGNALYGLISNETIHLDNDRYRSGFTPCDFSSRVSTFATTLHAPESGLDFKIDSSGQMGLAIPVSIYNVDCEMTGQLSRVFP